MKKIVAIPVPAYLKKFIELEFKFNYDDSGVLILKKRLVIYKIDDYKTAKSYFEQVDGNYPSIIVLTPTFRKDYLYAFITYCKQKFASKLCEYIAARHVLMEYSESIRLFLSSYHIYESEYSFATAYKNWQRSDEYRLIKYRKANEQNFKACG